MLAQLLERQGMTARVVASDAVAVATILQLDVSDVELVFLSYLEPGGFTNARYLVRRLRRKLPGVPIVAGFWTLAEDDARYRDALQRDRRRSRRHVAARSRRARAGRDRRRRARRSSRVGMKSANGSPRPADRPALLLERQRLKMARSAHAYVRGNTIKFYEWLDRAAARAPQGPPIWICGDCHVGNIGPVADADGDVDIQIRDLDQTVIGNPAARSDPARSVARHGGARLGLPGVTTAQMMEQMVGATMQAFSERARHAKRESRKRSDRSGRDARRRALEGAAEERIEDTKPAIPIGKRFWPLTREEQARSTSSSQTEAARRLATSCGAAQDGAEIEVLDAAYWVKGCSSLGRLRFAVLLGVGERRTSDGRPLPHRHQGGGAAAAPRAHERGDAARQRRARGGGRRARWRPSLGERMLRRGCSTRPVFMRELLPQDLKLEIEQLSRDEAMHAARYLA